MSKLREIEKANPNPDKIIASMNRFKSEVGDLTKGLGKCYGERRPGIMFPHGTVLVGLVNSSADLEATIDEVAARNGGYSPAGWNRPDIKVVGSSNLYRSTNGYRFTSR